MKRGDPQEPKSGKPNAADPVMLKLAQRRAADLGVAWEDVIERAGISRTTDWRLTKGDASSASMKKIERALAEIEDEKGVAVIDSRAARLREWNEIGAELLLLDDANPFATFNAMIERVRKVVDAKKAEADAMSALSHPLPPREK